MIARPESVRSYKLRILPQYDLVVIDVPGDGSCLFHCILSSTTTIYPKSPQFKRTEMVKEFRSSLADNLPQYYHQLGRGNIRTISKTMSEYTLESLQQRIRNSSEYVDNIFNEYISNIFDIDIYILSEANSDVYPMGADLGLLYKRRPSIVILYTSFSGADSIVESGHYQIIGHRRSDGSISKLFSPDYPLIKDLYSRLVALSS